MISILLVEPMNLLRGALAAALSQEEDFAVVAGLNSLDPALDIARVARPDVAVVNISLLAGEAARPDCAILALADSTDPVQLHRAFNHRLDGVISTRAPVCDLVDGIRRLVRGERVVDADLAVAMVTAPRSPLSPRELNVLSVAATGVPSTEVAARLHLSAGTVRNYISAILRKTGARNRLEAVRLAEVSGWLA